MTGSVASDRSDDVQFGASALAIDVCDVHKTYSGKIKALGGVHLRVPRGEVFGLLGPNGAGKSTLVKVLMTVIRADRAQGHVLGRPIGDKATLARVGYLPEHHRFPEYLTAAQVMHFFGTMAGVDRPTRRRRVPELLGLVGLGSVGSKRVRQFSKGMRQRLGLAQALVNDPEVLLLDEPTDGVDPEGRRDIRVLLGELRGRGKAVVINTHILAELELICDRAAIIYGGKLHDEGTIAQLTSFDMSYLVEALPPVAMMEEGELSTRAARIGAAMDGLLARGVGGVGVGWGGALGQAQAQRVGGEVGFHRAVLVRVSSTVPDDVQPVLDRLRGAGWRVTRVQCRRPSLEDAFMRVVERAKSGAAPMVESVAQGVVAARALEGLGGGGGGAGGRGRGGGGS